MTIRSVPIEPDGDVLTAEERAHARISMPVLAMYLGLILGVIAAACWYVLWLSFAIDVSAWAGLAIFIFVGLMGFAFGRIRLEWRLNEEVRRRRALRERKSEHLQQT